jgi:hypothetical protein
MFRVRQIIVCIYFCAYYRICVGQTRVGQIRVGQIRVGGGFTVLTSERRQMKQDISHYKEPSKKEKSGEKRKRKEMLFGNKNFQSMLRVKWRNSS